MAEQSKEGATHSGNTERRIAELAALDRELEQYALQGHWKLELPANLEPRSKLRPMHWKGSLIRERLLRAGELIGVDEAGRRTIQLLNPGLFPSRGTTHTLQMSIQLVLPGEVAAAHRHTMAALRFVVEGSGTFTTVNGDSFLMEPGDLILTPNWTWHDHVNQSDAPIIWIDGLDLPFSRSLDAVFMEEYPAPRQKVERVLRTSADSILSPQGSPWYFKWRDAERTLRQMVEQPPESVGGLVMEYKNRDGGPALPTIACGARMLAGGERTKMRRQTSVGIFHVVRGRGKTTIHDVVFEWEQGDYFVVPNWTWHRHENRSNAEEAFLFFISDRPLLEPFGLYRAEYGT
ncbi:MAG: cupin domain-containing protein [Candidatus Binatia bacterium]